jgi:two-component system chemotaxis sensor kinase CheA
MDDLLREFLTETGESLDIVDLELVRFEREPNNTAILEDIFRLVHTIKGTCGFLGLPRLEALTHAAESLMAQFRAGRPVDADAVTLVLTTIDRIKSLLEALERDHAEPAGDDDDLIVRLQDVAAPKASSPSGSASRKGHAQRMAQARPADGPATTESASASPPAAPEQDAKAASLGKIAASSIRVHVSTLDQLMTMVSELVLTRNQLIEIVRRQQESEFKAPLQRLSNVTAQLQEEVLKTRMQPIGRAWQQLPRIVRDLSAELGKPMQLEMHGAQTELDRQVLDLIRDPLTHMVRNAADHGVESPQQRLAGGKPEQGTIRIRASQEGGHILIEISDDGRGLDTQLIGAKAVALGLVSEAELGTLTETQVHRFIFAPGFSTAVTVTSVSGRGVGMDVVRANIDRIGGSIDVSSNRGAGTSFTIQIPLTLAIVSALIVAAAGERFAIPQLAVVELVRMRSRGEPCIEHIKDSAVLRLRDKLLPLVDLKTVLKLGECKGRTVDDGFVVVMQVGSQRFGIIVDAVFDTEEIVVKPMASRLRQIGVFSGHTILGDGSVILILDPNGLVHAIGAAQNGQPPAHEDNDEQSKELPAEPLLVFRAGSPNPKAVPLSLVTRLEEIDPSTIEHSNGQQVVQYRGQLMPLVAATSDVRIKSSGKQPLLVFSDHRRSMGLVVDEIVDIVEDRLDIELAGEKPGFIGSAVIKGQTTEVIDISHFLPLAFPDWRNWKNPGGDDIVRRALLVDDTAFFRNMLAPLLKAAGYQVTPAGSAEDALAAARDCDEPFDVIITDIDMPEMNGFELASVLRCDPRTAAVPIIGMSSGLLPESVERGKQVGLHDCVGKFDRRALLAALKRQTANRTSA